MSKKEVWRVQVSECEEGWGYKVVCLKDFETIEEAELYVKTFNARNDEKSAPSWYMVAESPVKIIL